MARVNLSAFDVIGPVMIGPSSSHTAGAARLGLAARLLLDAVPKRAWIGLHGSFAATGRGHATDRALVGGILGFFPDDVSLADALQRAPELGLEFTFAAVDLGEEAHPNSVALCLEAGERKLELLGASLGGGMIRISSIDEHDVCIGGNRPTLVCWHADRRGFLAELTARLAGADVNIASITTTRRNRGGEALTVVEADGVIDAATGDGIHTVAGWKRSVLFGPLP